MSTLAEAAAAIGRLEREDLRLLRPWQAIFEGRHWEVRAPRRSEHGVPHHSEVATVLSREDAHVVAAAWELLEAGSDAEALLTVLLGSHHAPEAQRILANLRSALMRARSEREEA